MQILCLASSLYTSKLKHKINQIEYVKGQSKTIGNEESTNELSKKSQTIQWNENDEYHSRNNGEFMRIA